MPNPNEEKLANFVQDTVLFNAVRAILFSQFDLNEQEYGDKDNQGLGEITRAAIQGRELLTQGFKEIEKYKKQDNERPTNKNPAV